MRAMAGVSVAVAPLSAFSSATFEYTSFDLLWWVSLAYLIIRLLNSEDPRWWVPIGAAIGLGIPLLGFHLAWMHYFVLALPLMACALRPAPPAAGSRAWTLRWLLGIAGTLLLFGGPLYLFRSSGPPPPALQYSIGTAILLLVALTDLAGGSPGARHTSPPG
jgi:hypothetical protein